MAVKQWNRFPEWLWNLLLKKYSKLNWTVSEEPGGAGPALRRAVDQTTSQGPFQPRPLTTMCNSPK